MAESTAVSELVCLRPRCGHRWMPRSAKLPKVCPKCKSYDWNKSIWEVENEVSKETAQKK